VKTDNYLKGEAIMAKKDRCRQCDAQVSGSTPYGLCPKCLIKVGFEGDSNNTVEESPLIEGPGATIGRYKLLELIGEGGMGLVYLAEQKEPVRRRVALKIVKLGMDTKQVVARFEAERQTLAVLEHPNIAHVFDAGTTDTGRPYFVMEYVKGMSITRYCDEHKLDIEKRLKLFRQVCEAVHHAHQKGIIHRDIKPSNILVSVQDDRAVPKIIDFGIAKAVTQPLTEKTSYTEQGQLLGTPEYMSPEQAEMAYEDIDTRSDIYSLGVVLYELLAGVPPFDAKRLREGGIDHIQQVICEEQPRTPSARLTSLGDKAKAVAQSRRTQIIALTRRLQRELEWIPMKAMRKDRTRRYRSASELADDIHNYLTGTPLIAGPESTIYRARKFIRKHAGSVATAALLAVVIILGLVVSILMGCRAEQAREKEATARKQVEQALVRAENAEKVAQERAEDYRRALYFNHIALAEISYRDGNIRRLRELLALCPADLRGWEWYRLNHIADQSCMTLCGHTDAVGGVAVSPDGKRIVSGSDDQTVRVWDATTGAELMTLRGHEREVGPVSFGSNGRKLVSISMDGTVKVWDAATGAEVMTLAGPEDDVISAAFSPDGKRIISGSHGGTLKLWDAAAGVELMTLRGHEGDVWSVSFSSDGKRIVSGSYDKTIKIWDAATGSELMTLRGHEETVYSVSVSPDGKRIASGSWDKTIKVWDVSTGVEVMTLRGHARVVTDVAFSPDGKRIVSGSADGTVKVWDAAAGAELMTLRGHENRVCSVVFMPDGKRIVSSSRDETIKVWDVAIDREHVILAGPQDGEGRVVFSPDGTRIISITGNGTIKVWDAATGTELTTLRGRRHGFLSLAFSPDGRQVISGSLDRTVKVWDAATGVELMRFRGHKGWVLSVAFSPDAKRVVSCSMEDKTIKVWDAATGGELVSLGHDSFVSSVAFSPDGERIVAGSSDETVRVWDASTGAELMTLRGHTSGVLAVAFSPDGKHIVSGSKNGTIKIWCAGSGKELMSVHGHTSRLRSVGFSPDGKRIISGSHDGTLKLWDAGTGVEVMTSRGHGSAVFSPGGKTIAFGTTLLEAAAPPNGYGPRRTGAAARELVDELYEEYGFYEEVTDKVNTDKTLAEPVRKVALQIANARLWEDAGKLNQESREVVSLCDRDIDAYQGALEKAEKANRLEPNTPFILTTLGVAQYRVGAYEDALEVLKRSEKIIAGLVVFGEPLLEPDPANPVFIAMALHQLDRKEEAKAALDRLRDLLKGEQFAEDTQAQAFLAEAERVLSGKEQ
jgi:WD40 repeat protein/serine/threonine protein kinase